MSPHPVRSALCLRTRPLASGLSFLIHGMREATQPIPTSLAPALRLRLQDYGSRLGLCPRPLFRLRGARFPTRPASPAPAGSPLHWLLPSCPQARFGLLHSLNKNAFPANLLLAVPGHPNTSEEEQHSLLQRPMSAPLLKPYPHLVMDSADHVPCPEPASRGSSATAFPLVARALSGPLS